MIDDQPEVSIDDPAFLFETNEGFQEVTSKKAQKTKQKVAQEEAQRKSHENQQQAKKEKKEAGKVCHRNHQPEQIIYRQFSQARFFFKI